MRRKAKMVVIENTTSLLLQENTIFKGFMGRIRQMPHQQQDQRLLPADDVGYGCRFSPWRRCGIFFDLFMIWSVEVYK
jgi:hypothetical protein